MKTSSPLKKHHFWVLLGLVPLLVLIAVVMISSGVGGDIEAAEKKTSDAVKAIGAKQNPKSDALIAVLDKQVDQVKGRKGGLWQANWDRQKDLYVWPQNSKLLRDVGALNLKFGAPIPNAQFEYDEFKKPEVYLAEYSVAAAREKSKSAPIPPEFKGMADTVAPTQFKGGWAGVLRHVNQFSAEAELTSEQIWLMLEDLWVQRSLLDAVRAVNAQMGRFERVKYEKNGQVVDDPAAKGGPQDPLRRKFKSRIWEVELEVVNRDNRKALAGRLINHTDRLQPTGLQGTMVLKVWLQPDVDKDGRPRPDVRPFEFKIGGDFVRGKGAVKADGKTPDNVLEAAADDDHLIPVADEAAMTEIYKVEQVFDTRTVPVRWIDALALGFTDSRHAAKQADLKMPLFPAYEKEKEREAAAATALPGTEGGATPVPKFDPGRGFGGVDEGLGKGPLAGPGKGGGGPVETVVNANKKRYVDVTESVRRLPVGIVLVVDQAYQQDVLLAFANSPLRFQVTQVNWARFRERRDRQAGAGGGFAGSGLPDDFATSGPGVLGEGLRPGGFGREGPGFTPPQPGLPGGTPAGPGTVSESQLTSGLIELGVYGIVSLYEQPPAPDAKDPKDGNEPKDPKK
jgi:hypothetical protein